MRGASTFPKWSAVPPQSCQGAARGCILVLLLPCLFLFDTVAAHARTWTVDRTGAGDFTQLQDAGDVAADGDTILIHPGRYVEYRPYDYGALTEDTYLVITAPNITVRGTDRDSVVIGPAEYSSPFPGEPNGISMSALGAGGLVIENLTIENVPEGIVLYDDSTVRSCVVRGCRLGVATDAVGTIRIEDVVVSEITTGFDMVFFGAIDSVVVERCAIEGRGMAVSAQPGARISRSTFAGTALGIQLGSSVLVEESVFRNGGSIATSESYVTLTRNRFAAGQGTLLDIRNGSVVGEENALYGASEETIHCWGGASLTLRRCDLYNLSGSSLTVLAHAYLGAEGVIDLRENWWGTTDPTEIEARIVDGADNPGDAPVVLWQPFLDGPVPTRDASMSELKSWFKSDQ